MQTAGLLPYPKLTWKSLDELDAGVCDGMTYSSTTGIVVSDLHLAIEIPALAAGDAGGKS
jgi:hypothetical protein